MEFNPLTAKREDIKNWCKLNGQVEWYKQMQAKTYEQKVYAKVKTKNEQGETVTIVDKNNYTCVTRHITFMHMRTEFIKEFFPQLVKAKEEKTPWWEEEI